MSKAEMARAQALANVATSVNRQQAEALARLAAEHGDVEIEYDGEWRLFVNYGEVRRARIHSTGKVEV